MTSDRTALYRVYGADEVLLYIGIAKNFGVRWQRHASEKLWWNQVQSQTIHWYDTRDEALDAEALAIFDEQPKHNVLHRKQAQRLQRVRKRALDPVPPWRRIVDRPGLMEELQEARARFGGTDANQLRDAEGYYTEYALSLMLSTRFEELAED